jgi:hypothetical protein
MKDHIGESRGTVVTLIAETFVKLESKLSNQQIP